jgi:hypothetical protein
MYFRLISLLLVVALAVAVALHVHSARYWSGETFAQLRLASAEEGLLVLVDGHDFRVAPLEVRRAGRGLAAQARLPLSPSQSPLRVVMQAGDTTEARAGEVRAAVSITGPGGSRWSASGRVAAASGARAEQHVGMMEVDAPGPYALEVGLEGGALLPGTTLELRRNTSGVSPWFIGGCAALALAIAGLNVATGRQPARKGARREAAVTT